MTHIKYYHNMDKSKWGKGPWLSEPDKAQWIDPATGLQCLIVRKCLGFLCGYVGIPAKHPYFGRDHDDVDVSVHGGMTFGNYYCPGQKDDPVIRSVDCSEDSRIWWIGFDCAHCDDYIPSSLRKWKGTYRNFNYVLGEVTKLARQLKERS